MEKIEKKPDIRTLSFDEIKEVIVSAGEKTFRAKQLNEWLWKRGVRSFNDMSNLSKEFREKLKEQYEFSILEISGSQKSKDGTVKTVFKLNNNELIEGVLIPSKERTTACISSQAGCALGCKFCATGKLKFRQNLTAGEIFDQVLEINNQSVNLTENNLSNIVFMGMGEPLLNYDNVMNAIYHITSPDGLGVSPRRITVSTVGICEGIRKLADDDVKFNLAVSLHTANATKRESLMPVAKTNPLRELVEAVKYFHGKTGSRVTFEYLLLGGVNDSITDAQELAVFCRNFPCKVNLIEYNKVEGSEFERSSPDRVKSFFDFLESKNMVVSIRHSRGKDIDAACGQLANKISNS
jgi:23S rRNA (adenine2503-C2)-methyltransferase